MGSRPRSASAVNTRTRYSLHSRTLREPSYGAMRIFILLLGVALVAGHYLPSRGPGLAAPKASSEELSRSVRSVRSAVVRGDEKKAQKEAEKKEDEEWALEKAKKRAESKAKAKSVKSKKAKEEKKKKTAPKKKSAEGKPRVFFQWEELKKRFASKGAEKSVRRRRSAEPEGEKKEKKERFTNDVLKQVKARQQKNAKKLEGKAGKARSSRGEKRDVKKKFEQEKANKERYGAEVQVKKRSVKQKREAAPAKQKLSLRQKRAAAAEQEVKEFETPEPPTSETEKPKKGK